jgi:aerobic-type carbon monoxide dehydrogenase small subunit (CoxS/CutS family)
MNHDERIAADRERVVEAVRERVAAGSAIPGSLTEVRAVLEVLDEARAECARLRSSALEQQRHREKAEESAREYRQAWQRDLGKGREHLARAEDAETALSNLRALHLGVQLDEARAERNPARRDLADARAQLAALHAAVARWRDTPRRPECDLGTCGACGVCLLGGLRTALADTATAAAEHERRMRADERVRALREAEAMLRRRAERASSAGATAVGLDGEIVRMHAGIFEAMKSEADVLAKMADEAERGTR